ncbi:hypothetical protein DMA11_20630 [Marinilabiliaceae bacterium JC017]|nr:hypothetical protein DMA11_20630 [Marinilabiliaceae bacterium JC017]
MGDTAIVFSVNRQADAIHNVKADCYYFYFHHQHINRSKGYFIGKPLDQLYVKHTREGMLLEKGNFKTGLKHGIWQEWYLNGEIKSQAKWRNGMGVGKKNQYAKNGDLVRQYKWKDGKWVLTRKYARMNERKRKKEEKAQKKTIRKDEKVRKKDERKQKDKFLWFGKKKNEVNNHISDIMPQSTDQAVPKKKGWNLFRRKNNQDAKVEGVAKRKQTTEKTQKRKGKLFKFGKKKGEVNSHNSDIAPKSTTQSNSQKKGWKLFERKNKQDAASHNVNKEKKKKGLGIFNRTDEKSKDKEK